MTRKKRGLLLLAVYALLLVAAIPLHTQKGIEWNDTFFRKTADGAFSAGKDNRFSFTETDSGLHFDLTLNGLDYQAHFTQPQQNEYLFAFSDGTALRLTGDHVEPYLSVGGSFIPLLGDTQSSLIITDITHPSFRFSPYEILSTPFYGENGQPLGEWVIYETIDRQHLYGYENWYDASQEALLPQFITLTNGSEIDLYAGNNGQTIFVNDRGEALVNTEALFTFPGSDRESAMHKRSCVSLLLHAIEDNVTSRGHFLCFVLSLIYLLGVLHFLFPETMAFFGSRWQYRYEPELSDSGLAMMKFSAVLLMLIGAASLYLPLILP